MKTCRDCGILKPLDQFPPAKKRSDGRASYCRACMNLRSQRSYRARQGRQGHQVREKPPAGFKVCPDCKQLLALEEFPLNKGTGSGRGAYCKPCHNARGKESKERLFGGSRHYHLVRRYGIGAADVDRMVEEQGGVCAICQENPAEHVDHCHETGRVRGILCFNCNGGLGQLRDRVDILLKAIAYLERTRDPQCQTLDSTGASRLPTQRREAALSPTSSEQLRLIF